VLVRPIGLKLDWRFRERLKRALDTMWVEAGDALGASIQLLNFVQQPWTFSYCAVYTVNLLPIAHDY